MDSTRSVPAPLHLALSVAPLLAGYRWAIGGSLLLYRLGLEAAPKDLDLVVVSDDFDQARDRLATLLTPVATPWHPTYASARFVRFSSAQGTGLDLMADIGVLREGRRISWSFDPARIERQLGLPWMHAEDWVTLYQLFGHPAKAARLAAHLERR